MFYRIARRLLIIFLRIIYRYNITGLENISTTGSVILCSNHISAMDPLMLIMLSKRQVHIMAKKELFEIRVLRTILRAAGAYPVDRTGADLKAYRHTMELLKNEKVLGIFSQGTRTQEFDNVKGGVAVFALKTNTPVVPVGIRGTYRPFSKINIHFGPPISMEPYAGQKVKSALIDEVMSEITSQVSALTEK